MRCWIVPVRKAVSSALMRRFTRLTNAFSKKLDNHIHALALYFVFYNFTRIHKSRSVRRPRARGAWRP